MTEHAPDVSDDDIRFYEEHGWWTTPWKLDSDLIEELAYGAERYYAGERDAHLPVELVTDWTPGRGEVLRQNDYVSLQIIEFRSFLELSPVPATAAALARTPSVRLFHDQFLSKPGGVDGAAASVGWHTDRSYWKTCTSTRMISAWIPLQDCTAQMGTLMVLDRSHKWEDRPEFRAFHTGDMTKLIEEMAAEGHEIIPVPIELEKGQVSFHHCMTMHGSYPNSSDQPRLAFAIHFQDEANAYREVRDSEGRLTIHINDVLCRKDSAGRPDYSDPDICPGYRPA